MPTPRANPPLAIVGASARAAAASAIRAGFQPVTADLFADADLRRIATTTRISPYPDGMVDWLRAVEPPAWMYTGALENHPELVDEMAWIAPLWGNPADVLARVRSPYELANALERAGLLFPDTRPSVDGLPFNESWLVKTYQGASGSGVRILGVDQESMSDANYHPGICFQKRVAGIPCAAVYIATQGAAQLIGVTQQLIGEEWLGAHGFQYAGSIGPWPVSARTQATLKLLGNVLSTEFELIGLFGVDFILEGDNVWTVEVNPRYTASVEVIERFSGISAIGAHAASCGHMSADEFHHRLSGRLREISNDVISEKNIACGKAILFATRDTVVTEQFAEFALKRAVKLPWPSWADVSPAGTRIEIGRPVCTLFARGNSIRDVQRRLRVCAIGARKIIDQ
jgi:uncharacterized protein